MYLPGILCVFIPVQCCSFVLNPLTPIQDTSCELQNETTANNPAAIPQRSVNLYYMVKLQIRSGKCVFTEWVFKCVEILEMAIRYLKNKSFNDTRWQIGVFFIH